ncbi:hypothetical protein LEP1GSC112_0559 [Leptospira interrogans serovar Pomona str. UT364]|nr:hypothetical protein LEP1GSC112_0559 [Leptospira interrogans serovar Pomona str. UT364]
MFFYGSCFGKTFPFSGTSQSFKINCKMWEPPQSAILEIVKSPSKFLSKQFGESVP